MPSSTSKRTKAEIMAVIAEYASLYGKRLTSDDLTLMAKHMGKWPPERLRALFDTHMKGPEGSFWPNPGHLEKIDRPVISASAVHATIMMAVHEARHLDACKRDERIKELLDRVSYRVYQLQGGYEHFAYMQESRYGFSQNACASTAKSLIDTGATDDNMIEYASRLKIEGNQ